MGCVLCTSRMLWLFSFLYVVFFFFFKQKTAYEMRISDWSSDVCSSDLWLVCCFSTSGGTFAVIGVFIPPGTIVFTRTPRSTNSSAAALLMMRTAALVAQ